MPLCLNLPPESGRVSRRPEELDTTPHEGASLWIIYDVNGTSVEKRDQFKGDSAAQRSALGRMATNAYVNVPGMLDSLSVDRGRWRPDEELVMFNASADEVTINRKNSIPWPTEAFLTRELSVSRTQIRDFHWIIVRVRKKRTPIENNYSSKNVYVASHFHGL